MGCDCTEGTLKWNNDEDADYDLLGMARRPQSISQQL